MATLYLLSIVLSGALATRGPGLCVSSGWPADALRLCHNRDANTEKGKRLFALHPRPAPP